MKNEAEHSRSLADARLRVNELIRRAHAENSQSTPLLEETLKELGNLLDGWQGALNSHLEPGDHQALAEIVSEKQVAGPVEAALRESEALFEAFMNNSFAAAFMKDEEGRYVYINPTNQRLLGERAEEWHGKTDFDLFPTETAEELRLNDSIVMQSNKALEVMERIPLDDGMHQWLTFKFPFVNAAGQKFIGGLSIDITFRQQAQEAIQSGETRYRALFQQSQEGILLIDPQTRRILDANQALMNLLGYTIDEVRELTIYDVMAHPEESVNRNIDLMMEQRRLFLGERQYRKKDNSLINVVVNINRVSHGENEVLSMIARDITRRRRTEESLRESEERFRQLAENIKDVFFITDAQNSEMLYVSPAYTQVWGRTPESLYAMPGSWIVAIHPQDRQRVLKRLGKGLGIQGTGEEFRVVRPDSSIRWVQMRMFPIRNPAGEVYRFAGVAEDITERYQTEQALRESEEQYRIVAETATDAIITIDDQSTILYVNRAVENIFGYVVGELIGQKLMLLMPEYVRLLHEAGLAQYLTTKKRHISWRAIELPGLHRSGREIPLEISFSDFVKDGRHYFTGIVRDISERKATEERLQQMNLQLMQSQKLEAMGTLTGGVAHEFRNILTAISLNGGFLRKKLDELDERRRYVDRIAEATDRAKKLTGQLLAFSRNEMLSPVVINLNDLISHEADALLQSVGSHIRLDLSGLEPNIGHVKADKTQIQQVLLNLALNARDAMEGVRMPTLSIATSNVYLDSETIQRRGMNRSGHYVRLSVADNGVGMDAGTVSRIFEPFFTTKEVGKGTGLGLSMAYGIIKQSEGYIWAESEVGKGTTFEIYLPRIDAPVETVEAVPPESEVLVGRETILLVEDDPDVRVLIEEELREYGYQVFVARHGEEALQIARQYLGPINLMITDLKMPKMGGEELVERLKAIRPDTQVLFISGYPQESFKSEQMTHFMQKPFETPLPLKIREVLDSSPSSSRKRS